MGVFTNIEVQIVFTATEDVDRAFMIMQNFREEIKENIYKEKPFHVNDLDFEGDDHEAEVRINSGREPNARFHVDCLIKLFQLHRIGIESFNADIIQPDAYICIDGQEDFDEIEINFE